MSNLSWLNPTPHAIAVYASQPLSPAATQHSLPSGRYSLLGPDFHRLDRTSLRLAHSFDHLVGEGEKVGGISKPSALAVFRLRIKFDLRDLFDGQIGWFLALENSAGIDARPDGSLLKYCFQSSLSRRPRQRRAMRGNRGHRVANRQRGEAVRSGVLNNASVPITSDLHPLFDQAQQKRNRNRVRCLHA